jgi:hypothetical protein
MTLLEKEASHFAASLDDYERVSVTDMGGWGPRHFWLVIHDHRLSGPSRSRRTAITGTHRISSRPPPALAAAVTEVA